MHKLYLRKEAHRKSLEATKGKKENGPNQKNEDKERENLREINRLADDHNAVLRPPSIIENLKSQAQSAKNIKQQLYIQTLLGAHKKVRGLSPNDTYPYDLALLTHAQNVWEKEIEQLPEWQVAEATRKKLFLRKAIDDARLPPEHTRKLHYLAKKHPDKAEQALELIRARIALDSDFSDIREFASARSDTYMRRHAYYSKVLSHNEDFAQKIFNQDVTCVESETGWKKPATMRSAGFYARAEDPKFWIRISQKRINQDSIQAARILQLLGSGPGLSKHLPLDVIKRKHKQIDFTVDWMRRTVCTRLRDGKKLSLYEIAKDKPSQSFNELQVRVIGSHNIKIQNELEPWFVTLTTPSRFHSTLTIARGGKKRSVKNKSFDPTLTANDSVDWLQEKWAIFRSLAQKIAGNAWSFFKILEAHSDATGHMHCVLYCKREHQELIHNALRHAFLFSDCADEPGAENSRVRIEKPRSDGGVKSYIMKALASPLKKINSGHDQKKPSAEALYTKAIGRRTFSLKKDNVAFWRWLRKVPIPHSLPIELHAAWAASHGIDTARLHEILAQRPSGAKFLFGFDYSSAQPARGEKTSPEDYENFLKSSAIHFKPGWLETDFYDIEEKTIEDFLLETADPKTGETDYARAQNAMDAAWHKAWDGDDSDYIKSKIRKKNKYGEDIRTPSSYENAPFWYCVDELNDRLVLAKRRIDVWTKDTERKGSANVLKNAINEKIRSENHARTTTQLQLIIQSQGATSLAIQSVASDYAPGTGNQAMEPCACGTFSDYHPPPH